VSGQAILENAVTTNWQNQTIWTGDNLPIMRGMNSGSVDLIYLDPPFNSNANYAAPVGSQAVGAEFRDTWGLSDIDLAWHGEIKHEYPALYDFLNAVKSIHGDSMMSYLIYMVIRIMEMKRILKDTGSIYLHCDPTASHYLKVVMDAIYGRSRFKAEINWQRTFAHSDSCTFGNVSDKILFYSQARINADAIRIPLKPGYVSSHYRRSDNRGRYHDDSLTGPGLSAGESGEPWRDYDPATSGRCWSVPRTGNYATWIDRNVIPGYLNINSVLARLEALAQADMLHYTREGLPRLKRYLHANPGQVPSNNWTDIPPINSQAKERIGYPTQKPLALLERIIKASSNAGDIVLDPFCGCATACIAAESLGRQWVGIDISPKAAELVQMRMQNELPLLAYKGIHRTDIPKRTDLGNLKKYNHKDNKQYL